MLGQIALIVSIIRGLVEIIDWLDKHKYTKKH